MKLLKNSLIAFTTVLTLISCSDDDNTPSVINEEEVITTLTATLTPVGGGETITLQSRDLDGDSGPNPPVMTISGNLTASTVYNGSIELLNETEMPAESISEEVKEEDEDHQFFFSSTSNLVTFSYSDEDMDGNPLGLEFTLTTSQAGTDVVTFTLRHEPNKDADGVSDGDITNAGGETDISISFNNVTVQ